MESGNTANNLAANRNAVVALCVRLEGTGQSEEKAPPRWTGRHEQEAGPLEKTGVSLSWLVG